MKNKIYSSFANAVKDIENNSTIMVGGFGLCGNPENLINAIYVKGIKNITLISNNCGTTKYGLGILLNNNQIRKIIASYVGENTTFENQFLSGDLEVELVPQGTLAEKIRSGGAGIPAFYTNAGVGTLVEDGGIPMKYNKNGQIIKSSIKKEYKIFSSIKYLMETTLKADVALIKAYKSDSFGNLVFRKSSRNFNSIMCSAAKNTIVEVEHIVDNIDPDEIHVSGIYVDRILEGKNYKKRIERLTTREKI